MRLAYLQFAPRLAEPEANREMVATSIRTHLSRSPADVLVLPELANSGYSLKSRERAYAMSEELDRSPFLSELASICAEHGTHIVTGFNEREGQHCFNSAVLVGPKGPVGHYRKLHLFWDELDLFEPGNAGLPVFDLGFCKLGMLVCFDWVFPEVWRVLALKGADVICHPSNLVLPGFCQKAVPVHALVNRVYVVTSNRVGSEGELNFTGNSLICGPRGEVLCEAPAHGESYGVVEVDVAAARNKRVTPRNDVFADRRPMEYSALLDRP